MPEMGLVETCQRNSSSPFNVPDMFLPVSRHLCPQCDLTADDEVIDLTDSDDKGTSVEIEEIGGPIEYVWASSMDDHLSYQELENIWQRFSLIPEEDYEGPMAVEDR